MQAIIKQIAKIMTLTKEFRRVLMEAIINFSDDLKVNHRYINLRKIALLKKLKNMPHNKSIENELRFLNFADIGTRDSNIALWQIVIKLGIKTGINFNNKRMQ